MRYTSVHCADQCGAGAITLSPESLWILTDTVWRVAIKSERRRVLAIIASRRVELLKFPRAGAKSALQQLEQEVKA